MKPTFFSIFGIVLMTLSGCFAPAPLFDKTLALNVGHVPSKPLHVKTANGKVEVNGSARADVAITATIRAISEERLQQTTVEAKRDADGTLVIETAWPAGKRKSREGCHFTVDLPNVSRMDLQSSNGALKVQGLAGDARLTTSNGTITVEGHGGPVYAETSNGMVDLQDVRGDVEMKSNNGKLKASAISGAVLARTSNGSLEVALSSQSRGPINATSSNGSITLVLNRGFGGSLDLKTTNGSVKVDDSLEAYVVSRTKKKEARLQIGDGSGLSKATTSNGSIRVSQGR